MSEPYKKTLGISLPIFFFTQLFNFLFYVIFYKYFSLQEIGIYSSAMAILSFYVFLLDIGISNILIREFSQKRLTLKTSLKFVVFIRSIVIFGSFLLLNFFFLNEKISVYKYWLLILIGISLTIDTFSNVFLSWFSANYKQITKNYIFLITSLCKILGLTLLILLAPKKAISISLLLLMASCMQFTITIILYSLIKKEVSVNIISEITFIDFLKSISPFLITGLLVTLQNRVDWILIASFVSQIELANYAVANRLYEQFLLFIGFFIFTSYPWICKNESTKKFKLVVFHKIIVLGGSLLAFGCAIFMPQILSVLWGNKYQEIITTTRILFFTAGFSVLVSLLYYNLIANKMENKIIVTTFLATLLQIIIDLLLIPCYGGLGAAIGISVMIILTFLGFFLILKKDKDKGTVITDKFTYVILFLLISVMLILIDIPNIIRIGIFIGSSIFLAKVFLFNNDEIFWLIHQAKNIKLSWRF